jgi:hypothetical protein
MDSSEPREIYHDEDPARFQGLRGAVWIRSNFRVETSNFGAKVAHLLDRLARGIHNIPGGGLRRAQWHHNDYVEVSLYGCMSTYDSDDLTRLVFLCHELSVRGRIGPCGPRHLRLGLSRRIRNGGLCDGHPTLERALIGYDPARFGGSGA